MAGMRLRPSKVYRLVSRSGWDTFGYHSWFDDGHALREGAAADAANADTAHIIIVIDGGDQHLRRAFQIALGRGDIFQNRVKQRAQVLAGLAQIQRGGAQTGAGIDDGTVQRGFIRAQLDEQIQHLVHHFVAACIRTIHLVDYHDDRQLQCQRLFSTKRVWGMGPSKLSTSSSTPSTI